MSLESASFIADLVATNPPSTDPISQADDHIRLIKSVLQSTFPNIRGAVSASDVQLSSGFAYVVPIGGIIVWYGSSGTVPTGWHICDGTAGIARSDGSGTIDTPNLVDHVVVGAGTLAAQGTTVGALTNTTSADGSHTHAFTGSSHTHTFTDNGHALTIPEMPAHNHGNGIPDGNVGDFVYGTRTPDSNAATHNMATSSGAGPLEGLTATVGGGGSHSHSGTTASTTTTGTNDTDAAHSHTNATVQPSYGLHYIMKV